MENVIAALIKHNERLVDALITLASINKPDAYPSFPVSGYDLSPKTEEVEDGEFNHRNGLISDGEMDSILRRSGFPSDEYFIR